MCTYTTERLDVFASAKGPQGWFPATRATVYFDHPVHHPSTHALMIDILGADGAPGSRVGLELDPASARALAEAILKTLADAPAFLLEG